MKHAFQMIAITIGGFTVADLLAFQPLLSFFAIAATALYTCLRCGELIVKFLSKSKSNE